MQTKNEKRKNAVAQSEQALAYLRQTLGLAEKTEGQGVVVWDKNYPHDEGVKVLRRKIQHHENMINRLNSLINY